MCILRKPLEAVLPQTRSKVRNGETCGIPEMRATAEGPAKEAGGAVSTAGAHGDPGRPAQTGAQHLGEHLGGNREGIISQLICATIFTWISQCFGIN